MYVHISFEFRVLLNAHEIKLEAMKAIIKLEEN